MVSAEQFELLAASLLADVFREAEAAQWQRRAEEFERCKPTLDEFHGQATPERLSAQWQRADETARACRSRAAMCRSEDWSQLILADVRDLDAECQQRRPSSSPEHEVARAVGW